MSIRLNHSENNTAEFHEINVTPFIDVMLVLLIIFMVAAPLATVDVHVELPSSTAQAQPRPEKPIFLTLKADHTFMLGDQAIARNGNGLVIALDHASHEDKDQIIFLRADKTVEYETLMQSLNSLRAAGYLKVALVGLGGEDAQ
ncbi:TPA: TonB system transport protein ExbD [Raoultella ornithinolytica]